MKDKLLVLVLRYIICGLSLSGIYLIYGPLAVKATAAIYYVGPAGSDSNSCATAQTRTTPKLTIAAGVSCLVAGDTLYLRSGTYVEPIHITTLGTVGNWITVGGDPADTPLTAIIQLTNSQFYPIGATVKQYHIYQNLVVDGTNRTIEDTNGTVIYGKNDATPDTSHDVIIQDMEIRNIHGVGIFGRAQGNITIRRNKIHDMFASTTFRFYCMYIAEGDGFDIYQNECYNAAGGGVQIYNKPKNVHFYNNYVHDVTTLAASFGPIGCMIVQGQSGSVLTGIVIDSNIFANCGTPTSGNANGTEIHQYTNGVIFRRNICHNNKNSCVVTKAGTGVQATTNAVIENNIALSQGGTISDSGVGTVLNTNKTTGSVTDCTASTSNFVQKAGSSCTNAGTARVGYASNGLPDIAATDVLVFASCTVENATPTKLTVIITNNVFPPLLPASGITGFTARKAGANDPITPGTRVGDNQIDFTLTNTIANGDAVDISYSGSGNLTDSANIGGLFNQPYNTVLTNQSCTNNVGAPSTYQVAQTDFAWHGLRGTEAAPINTPYAAAPQNTNIFVIPNGKARLRVSLKDTVSDAPPAGYIPYFSRNSGAYAVLGNTYGTDHIAFCGSSPDADIPASGTATTNQLTTTGTFVPGALIRTSNAIPTIAIPTGQKSEMEYCIAWDSTANPSDTYDIRVRTQDGVVLPSYVTTPRATIIGAQHGSAF